MDNNVRISKEFTDNGFGNTKKDERYFVKQSGLIKHAMIVIFHGKQIRSLENVTDCVVRFGINTVLIKNLTGVDRYNCNIVDKKFKQFIKKFNTMKTTTIKFKNEIGVDIESLIGDVISADSETLNNELWVKTSTR